MCISEGPSCGPCGLSEVGASILGVPEMDWGGESAAIAGSPGHALERVQ